MKILNDISEDEMIATFLKAEITSTRFGERIHKILEKDNRTWSIIENPDIENAEENLYRKEVLQNHRGYTMNLDIFENFPTDVVWKKALLSKEELQEVKYIKYDYWIELSGGTRLAKDAAKNVSEGKEIFGKPNEKFLKAVEAVKNGAMFEKLIMVAPSENDYLVVLEGHLRLTSYCMALEYLPEEIEIIVGFSEGIKEWGLY